MRVIAVRRHPAADPAPAHEQWGIERLHEMLAQVDSLVLAAPLTPDTRGMIGKTELAQLRPHAVSSISAAGRWWTRPR
jgi:phosphoglycerate dehydrogenase-like enzyme